jgi:hypothetical protein
MKNMSKKKFKTSEPFGSALWLNLLRYRIVAIVHYGCVSDALHIPPQDACNFSSVSFWKKESSFFVKIVCQKLFS